MIHKTTRSILSVLLAALLLVTSTPLTPAFADGGGVSPQSANNESRELEQVDGVYQISTAAELQKFAQRVNNGELADANAVLTANIDLSEICGENVGGQSASWTPIGSDNRPYTGTFNGNGKTISGLYIDSSDNDQGLFGYVGTRGTVQNLTVSGSVKGDDYVGGVVGDNRGSVEDCDFTGSVSGNSYVGGVVGVVGVVGDSSGSVKNCYNTGAVSSLDSGSGNSVGGVVGYNDIGGSVTNCYNTGSVNGSIEAGGVVGSNSLSATVTNCYNTGEVSGMYVGGVVGWNRSSVINCYNTGSVSDGTYTGGVVGYNHSGGSVTGCYFLQDTAGSGIGSSEESGATAESVKDLDELCDTLKSDPWTTSPFCKHPVLKANPEGGLGTATHPYEIKTAAQLETFRDIVNDEGGNPAAWAVLMENITLNSSEEWEPIGNEDHRYTGTFDGNGKTISGFNINSSSGNYQGLFGYLSTDGDNTGTVKDLTVSGNVSGYWYVGGVVGYNNGGTVTGCIFSGSGTVTGTGDYVGGVVGDNRGSVENCHNIGEVSGNRVGGVVGYNGGNVENCYNTGTVTGTGTDNYVGGVVGLNRGIVTNCYNTGSVSGSYVGGVVGLNFSSDSVTNCYFLQGTAEKGIGANVGSGDATATEKDRATFQSGEVAYLLQSKQTTPVWGQNIGEEDSWPTLVALDKNENAKPVYKVAFISDNTEIEAEYANNGMTVGSPTTNPTKEGYTFAGWFTESSGGSQWNFNEPVNKSMTLYAQWTAVEDPDPEPTPDPEPEEPPYTGKYSYELSTSVGDHGSLTVDRYATEGEKVTITVTPDEAYKLDDLSVTAHGKDVELTANSDGTYTFTMPSADVKISATFAEDPDWTEPEEPATDVSDLFIDIAPDAWYKDAIQYAYDQGLMTGVSATEFAPEATTTRAMIVSILARLENVTTAEAAGFADVDDNDWYATAVNWAANVGVVNGYEDNTFQPNTAITREQLAAILMNYANYKGQDTSARAALDNYTDQPSTWAQEAMQWAVAEGLISGVTADTLQPQGAATRAQVAAILERFLAQ